MIKIIKNRKHEIETEYYQKKKDDADLRNNQIEYLRGKCDHWNKKLKIKTSASNYDEVSLYHTKSPTFHSCIKTTTKFKQRKIWVNFFNSSLKISEISQGEQRQAALEGPKPKRKEMHWDEQALPTVFSSQAFGRSSVVAQSLQQFHWGWKTKSVVQRYKRQPGLKGEIFQRKGNRREVSLTFWIDFILRHLLNPKLFRGKTFRRKQLLRGKKLSRVFSRFTKLRRGLGK